MRRLTAVGVLLAIEIFIRFESWIFGIAELSGFFVRHRVAGLRAFATSGMRIQRHACLFGKAPWDLRATRSTISLGALTLASASNRHHTVVARPLTSLRVRPPTTQASHSECFLLKSCTRLRYADVHGPRARHADKATLGLANAIRQEMKGARDRWVRQISTSSHALMAHSP